MGFFGKLVDEFIGDVGNFALKIVGGFGAVAKKAFVLITKSKQGEDFVF